MAEKEFNLLHEPWIRVMRPDATVDELNLSQVLTRAHEYRSLAGEMPTQDVAMLRLLLAVLHAVFTKVDINGASAPLRRPVDALVRWKALWECGSMPAEPIEEYLRQYEERFWLFHPERPFWQARTAAAPAYPFYKEGSAELVKASGYRASKLNGEILQSENKLRIFANRGMKSRDTLTYGEAARWLLQLNGYDDSALKGRSHNREKFKDGWLGHLGVVYAAGRNLFETLMLNFVLLDHEGKLWSSATPVWERDWPDEKDLVKIPIPHDQAALLTLQSRRIFLQRENGVVTGYQVLAGEQFDAETAFGVEQMTLWKHNVKENKITPALHEPSRQFWREFSALASLQDGDAPPGCVRWQRKIRLPRNYMVNYCAVGMKYGKATPHGSVDEVFSDSLSFRLQLLSDVGDVVRKRVIDEIERCEKMAQAIWWLAINLRRATGGNGDIEKKTGDKAAAQFYHGIDMPFRKWLLTLDAELSEEELLDRQYEWQEESRSIALRLGSAMVTASGSAAFTGRVYKQKREDRGELITAASAFNAFKLRINKLTARRDADVEE